MIKGDQILSKLTILEQRPNHRFVFKDEDLDCLEDAIDSIPHTKSLGFSFL